MSRSLRRMLFVLVALAVGLVALAAPAAFADPPAVIGPDGLPHPGVPGATTLTVLSSAQTPTGPLSTCSPGYAYAGYIRSSLPGNGSAASAGVTWNTTTLYGGHVGGWVGPTNGSATLWIQAGLERSYGDSSISKYIEYNTGGGATFVSKGTASAGALYTARVTKVSSGVWTASIGGSALGYNVSISGLTVTEFLGESLQGSSGSCNVMDINFSSSSPWGTAGMSKIANAPYVVDSITSNGWRSHGS